MKLFNTLTRSTDELKPIATNSFGVYTCGPTVYDYAHIGHWYNYVRMDTLVRALQSAGNTVNWVMNITDVGHLVSDADDGEDKLEKGAKREGKTAWEVAEFYTQDFLEAMELLNIQKPDHVVKATDHIAEQIELIQRLEAKGYTYIIDDGVYFDTSKFEGYSAFAGLDLDEQQAGARVSINDQKRNQADFAVWKFSPTDSQRDMEWDNPFGNGRKGFPGWHIECSAMSMKYLGESFDIHTGGIDHIPVHHTNEIAQSEAATGKRFANYWMHSNHVTVNGEKISKSLGNGIRLQEIIAKGISAEAVRLNILESHYRSQSKFSWDSLEAAKNRLQHWQQVAVLVKQPQAASSADNDAMLVQELAAATSDIAAALNDDLNTPVILSRVDQALSVVEKQLISATSVQPFTKFLSYLEAVLGINLLLNLTELPQQVATLLEARSTVRSAKDWAESDSLRDQLAELGYGVKDLPNGTTIWFKL
ncbi:MAG: cysteine--tRNA ligase [Patescibacteria group bacterium]|nr:cysteine--tRNA ligase [Patescibacteria group bacterium]